ncbi:uncharacterized protein PgNI_05036, partial [Pyricularia grisea]|uniref:Uncharacterized protein n=1 Tax=Pyricularia grisea TaxID=148305 RepID=A0A6P8BAW6_PYRGI
WRLRMRRPARVEDSVMRRRSALVLRRTGWMRTSRCASPSQSSVAIFLSATRSFRHPSLPMLTCRCVPQLELSRMQKFSRRFTRAVVMSPKSGSESICISVFFLMDAPSVPGAVRGPLPLSLRFGVRLLFIRVVAPDQAAAYSECLGFLQRTYMVFLTFSATCRRRIAAASSFDGS